MLIKLFQRKAARFIVRVPYASLSFPSCNQHEAQLIPVKFVADPYEYHEEIQVKVKTLTSQGHGVAIDPNYPERTVLIPKVWPGEIVTARIFRNQPWLQTSEADLVRVDVPSPERISPKCKLFLECSGCQLQHVSVEAQRGWKRHGVLAGLRRAGCDIAGAQLDDMMASGPEHSFGYRSKITPQVSLHKTRNKNSPEDPPETFGDRELNIGFQRINSRRVLDVDQCPLATPALNERYRLLREEVAAAHLLKSEEVIEKGPGRRQKQKLGLSSRLLRDDMRGTVHVDPNAPMTQEVHGLRFTFKAGEFYQVNPFLLPALVTHVVGEARGGGSAGCSRLIDAYCGSGLFSLSAASQFSSVVGIEVSQVAVRAATQNAVDNGISNVEFIWGKVDTLFSAVHNAPSALQDVCCVSDGGIVSSISARDTAVIIDPSRKGCDESFLSQLLQFSPRRVVYVSCNPATQARDASRLLKGGFRVSRVTPFDMFPQTKHVECVITFENSKYQDAE